MAQFEINNGKYVNFTLNGGSHHDAKKMLRGDLEAHYGMVGHPKAGEVFDKAFFYAVEANLSMAEVYEDLVNLVK